MQTLFWHFRAELWRQRKYKKDILGIMNDNSSEYTPTTGEF